MNKWIEQIFEAQQVAKGGIVRRSIHSVEKEASEKELVAAVKKRKFHMIQVGEQYVIYCRDDVSMIC